jgi:hypothetical protein
MRPPTAKQAVSPSYIHSFILGKPWVSIDLDGCPVLKM